MCVGQVTGGRNGFGAKLCNIFSTRFEVETCDGKRQRRFHQARAGRIRCLGAVGGVA